MDEKCLKALKGSIRKWESFAAGIGIDCGPRNCDLCKEYSNNYFDSEGIYTLDCSGCPINKYTEGKGCENTPYEMLHVHMEDMHPNGEHFMAYCYKCRELAQDEVDFLKSLLPEE